MCLGLPGRVAEPRPGTNFARVDVAGVLRDINVELLDAPVVAGEYLLVHSGFALERMSADEARDALGLFAAGAAPGADQIGTRIDT